MEIIKSKNNKERRLLSSGGAVTLFATVFLSLTTGSSASSSESSVSNVPSVCETSQTELFSCQLESEKRVSLCLDSVKGAITVQFADRRGQRTNFVFQGDLHQIVGSASGSGSTIVQGNITGGAVTFYVDNSTAEPSPSGISYPQKQTDLCLDKTVRDHMSHVDIWHLLESGLAKPFTFDGDDRQRRRSESALWRSWPQRTAQ